MKLNQILQLAFVALAVLLSADLFANDSNTSLAATISGKVLDVNSDEPLISATVTIVGSTNGTVTDLDGNFVLTAEELPVTIEVSFIGFESQQIEVNSDNATDIIVKLDVNAFSLDQVVVSASKYEQRLVTTPVTVEKLSAAQLLNSPTADFYESFASMRGVQANTGSMVFTSFNTRGFGDPNNLRFIQHLDGMDITTPGFGIIGNTAGASSLDIAGMELLPGASSALYGPDAFNGIMLMSTKNPFTSPGFSFEWKTGFTKDGNNDKHAYNDISFRHAHKFSENLALKIDANTKLGKDWVGADFSNRIGDAAAFANRDQLLQSTRETNPAHNAVNRYGDGDFGVGIIGNMPLVGPDGQEEAVTVTRTGLSDNDVWNKEMQNFRINASLHYKFGKNWEASVLHKFAKNDFAFRITTFYPFEGFEQQHTKFEITNNAFTLRAYSSRQRTNQAHIGFLTAASTETTLKSNADWTADYQEEYSRSGNHVTARAFADRDVLDSDGNVMESRRNEYESLRERFSLYSDQIQGGGGFLDNSGFKHVDLDYDFGSKISAFRLQIGANLRRYNVTSDGEFFNDNKPNGITGDINFTQAGAFAQVSKNMLNNQLTFTGSLRYDKHEHYEGQFSPRVALTYGVDSDRNHNFRASYQTAFRNPGLQESFLDFDLFSFLKILGTNSYSLENWTYTGPSGTSYSIHDIVPDFVPLEPEKNTTVEVGYRGIFNDKLLVDVNFYNTRIPNFIYGPQAVFQGGMQDFKVFLYYQNGLVELNTYGYGASADYNLGNGFIAGLNYNFNTFNLIDFDAERFGDQEVYEHDLRYNMPENRFNLSIGNVGFGPDKALSVNLAFRYTSEYFYKSSFGETIIPATNNTDFSFGYKLPLKKNHLKLSLNITNLFDQKYSYVYGGGTIGSIYTVGIRYTPDGK